MRADLATREPEDADWPAILALANRSVADVPGAGAQDDWAENRRSFAARGGFQQHWVVDGGAGVVGYAAVEQWPSNLELARIFIVTEPERRGDLGPTLLDVTLAAAVDCGAREGWMMEYAADEEFLRFLRARGFEATRRVTLDGGADAVILSRALG